MSVSGRIKIIPKHIVQGKSIGKNNVCHVFDSMYTIPYQPYVYRISAGRWPNGRALPFGTVVCVFESRSRHGCL